MGFSVNAGISVSGKKNIQGNPNPVNACSWKDVYKCCPAYEDCFDYSIEQDWHFWSCAECPRYKKTTQAPPKASPKISVPTDMPKSTSAPAPSPQPKTGLWHRFASMLGAQK
jgi:hypothetical protein